MLVLPCVTRSYSWQPRLIQNNGIGIRPAVVSSAHSMVSENVVELIQSGAAGLDGKDWSKDGEP